MSLDTVLTRIDTNMPEALERLKELLRIASISTDPAYKADCDKAADWLVRDLNSMGIAAEKRPTPGHPMVVAHAEGPGPHLLFYGHYDVQPVDPLELWHNDPFDPQVEETEKGPVIRGRGTSDDKGQLMTFLEACRAWIAEEGQLPCRMTFFFEGEEESGSPSLAPFMKANAEELRADLALICDTSLFESRVPGIEIMLRGMLQEEITVTGPRIDLHSGIYGGAAINPVRVLAKIIASLHDDQGRITVPDFYAGVEELPEAVRAQWEGLDFDAAAFLGDVGLSHPAGEQGRSALEMTWSRPTCEVNGMGGGYQGEGSKTVIPSEATAKSDIRLVPNLTPELVFGLVKAHLARRGFDDITVTESEAGLRPSKTDAGAPIVVAAQAAILAATGMAAELVPNMAGSGPMYDLCDIHGIATIGVGAGLVFGPFARDAFSHGQLLVRRRDVTELLLEIAEPPAVLLATVEQLRHQRGHAHGA